MGASIGNGFHNKNLTDLNGEDFKLKQSALAWKIYGATSWKFIGLEGGYRDFGKIESDRNGETVTSNSRGGDIFAKGTFNIAIVEVFGKAGAFFSRTRNEGGGLDAEETNRQTAFAWGVGAGLNFGFLHLRLEYENMHTNPDNLGMLSFGAWVNLGSRD